MWLLSYFEGPGFTDLQRIAFTSYEDLSEYCKRLAGRYEIDQIRVYTKPQKAEGKKDPLQGLPEPLSR